MSCLLYVHVDGGVASGVPYIFLQGPCCLPYEFFITSYVIALGTVDYPTLLSFGVLVFGFHEDLLNCIVALEVSLYPILTTGMFEAFH